ncbi:MAG TPA: hypothetical protein VFQ85_10920 [Mycobacteriales bacterium]|jgi:hypothetical protein|nr:hypothetical protein [Mycobacteriales bacterium]
MRTVLTAAVAVAAFAVPAHGADSVTLTCAAHYNAYGVGATSGTAYCTVSGTYRGNATLTFASVMSPALCPAQETATGRLSGAITADVTWQRYGDSGPFRTHGAVNGIGMIEVFVTSPIGAPCGGPVDATFVITFAGS